MTLCQPRQKILAGLLILFVASIGSWKFVQWWSRPAVVEFDNLKYIQLLTTAVSSRQLQMVEQVEEAVSVRFNAEEMSAPEHEHFQKLIKLARDKKWEEADRKCHEFAQAQIHRRRVRSNSGTHSH